MTATLSSLEMYVCTPRVRLLPRVLMCNGNSEHVELLSAVPALLSYLCRLPTSTPVQKGLLVHWVDDESGAQGSNMSLPHSWKWWSWDSNPMTPGKCPLKSALLHRPFLQSRQRTVLCQVFWAGHAGLRRPRHLLASRAAEGKSAPSGCSSPGSITDLF